MVAGALRATSDIAVAIAQTDISLICVGTPSASNGSLATVYLERVAEEIGAAMRDEETRGHTVVFRAHDAAGHLPEPARPGVGKSLGQTGRRRLRGGRQSGVPARRHQRQGLLRAAEDRHRPVRCDSGDLVAELYGGLPGEVFRVPIPVAEMAKYADNTFHGLKIGFANEMGAICQAIGLDSHDVMDMFMADTKLNISTAYLRPGFAFGGSCLPKDLRAWSTRPSVPTCRCRFCPTCCCRTRRTCGALSTQ